jgi:hypothetical protein
MLDNTVERASVLQLIIENKCRIYEILINAINEFNIYIEV